MKSWLEQPKLIPVRERIVSALTPEQYRFRRVSPVVFLCGGFESRPRDNLRDYLHLKYPNLGIFYAERVWEVIASNPGLGALKMESDLAALSDLVIIIVESPGTFAELGAFSLVDPLRRKLLPIVDERFRKHSSFINTGPIRWVDEKSDFRPTVWVELDKILRCAKEIEARIASIPRPKSAKLTELANSRKHLLFFVCDLVAVIAPATIESIEYFLGRIMPAVDAAALEVSLLAGLAEAMGLLRKDVVHIRGLGEHVLFSAANPDALQHPYHRIKWVDLAGLRAEFVSKLLVIPEASEILREVNSRR
jgi:hypothetical protein